MQKPINHIATLMIENHYYPFGLQISGLSFNKTQPKNKYLYNGKELQDDFSLGWLDYGKRFYDAEVPRFTSIDRFAEKYSFMSPYQYAANNPVNFIDVNGDSLWINTGYRNLLYQNGKLYNKKGKEVRSKLTSKIASGKKHSSFIAIAVGVLNKINGTEEGNQLVSTLQESHNNFIITQGVNRFVPGEKGIYPKFMNNAQANRSLIEGKPVVEGLPFDQYGSGGLIYWNPNSNETMITASGEVSINPTQSLTHEMGHAYDANAGQLDTRYINAVYGNGTEQISEYRADYFMNMVSKRLGLPLRTQHSEDGPPLLKNGNPIYVTPSIFMAE